MSSTFGWSDVTYGVGKNSKSKEILKGISGSLDGGEVCAILGPSGSGKTSLLNVLANRIRNKGASQRVAGNVLLDGKKLVGGALRKRIAYVMQQDLLFATQTPREAILFSAMLRLPHSMAMSKKRALTEEMLTDFGLLDCADTYCGDEMIRGISGGEKKRTSIAIELVMRPKLIFLDEPTSGLDSFAAQNVCKKLVEMGQKGGCNILCTIHQPSSEVFHLFSKVMTLYKGKCLYFGSIKGLSLGLTANGVGCPQDYSLADHVLTVIQTSEEAKLEQIRTNLREFGADKASSAITDETPPTPAFSSTKPDVENQEASTKTEPSAGFLLQLYALTLREAGYVWRNKPGLIASIIAPLLLNSVFACIFQGAGDSTSDGYLLQGHFGAVTQVLIGGMFGSAQPLLLRFPLDRGIFLREYATATYGSAPYFLSKTMVELPQAFINSVLTWLAYYWIVGLQGSWIFHVLIFWISGCAAGSTALLVGCLASNAEVAQQSAPAVFVFQLFFTGLFIPVTAIPVGLRWIQWIASLKYAVGLATIVEFGQATQEAHNWTESQRVTANAFIEMQDVDPDRWWFYMLMIICLFCFFRTLSILALAWRARHFF